MRVNKTMLGTFQNLCILGTGKWTRGWGESCYFLNLFKGPGVFASIEMLSLSYQTGYPWSLTYRNNTLSTAISIKIWSIIAYISDALILPFIPSFDNPVQLDRQSV